jgi:sugar lactone lactonase YvrE
MTWDGTNAKRFWQKDGYGPCAVLPWKKGELLVACYDRNCLVRLDSSGKWLEDISEDANRNSFKGPNDLAADSAGGVYFSASGEWKKGAKVEGKIYYRTPEGKVCPVAEDIY